MKKKRKLFQMLKKRKWILIPLVLVLAVGVGAGVLLRGRSRMVRGMEGMSTTQSAQAENGSIKTTVIGTGNLENADAENVYLPEGVEIEEVMVSSGDHVEEGDVLAKLNAASITAEMLSIQEEISDLDEQINEVKDETESDTVETKISGRIKKIYAKEGDSVADVMAEHGALALLSVDGKMAVEIKNVTTVSVGDTVSVTLSDGSTVKEGTVASLEGTTCVITLTDQGTTLGELVTVEDEDGKSLGNGKLTIHQQLEITAAAGSIESIEVSENEAVEEGETLMILEGVPASAKYQELVAAREELTQRLQSFMALSKENTLKAEFSGTVQSVNISDNSTAGSTSAESSASSSSSGASEGAVIGTRMTSASSSKSGGASLVFLSTSAKESETEKAVARETETADVEITSITDLITVPEAGQEAQTQIAQDACTGQVEWTVGGAAFRGAFAQGTVYTAKVTLQAAEGYAFATDNSLTVTQNKASSLEWKAMEDAMEITMVFQPTDINSCAISITAPQAGAAPQTVINGTQFYSGAISWSPQAAAFASNMQYIAQVKLTANEGYQFSAADKLTVTLNGNPISQVSVSEDASQVTLILVYQIGEDGTSKEPDSEAQTSQSESGAERESQPQTDQQNQSESQRQTESQGQTEGSNAGRTTINPSEGTTSGGTAAVSGQGSQTQSSGTGNAVSGSSSSDANTEDAESGVETADAQSITAFTISPEENMSLAVSVDELDILSIALDQKAEVTFDAIEDETFEGTITGISDTASVNGGVAKYTVDITIPKSDSMKVGMNASATITIEDKQDILLIPVSALQEAGDRVFVYTEKDEDTGALSGEVEVETGISDGTNVEIVSGLEEGDTVYYTRTEATSDDAESGMGQGGMGQGGMMGGGQMPSGEMPSGERPSRGGFSGGPGGQ